VRSLPFILTGIGLLLLAGGGAAIVVSTIRGIRNNNPTNLRHSGDKWQGMSPVQSDSGFVQFETPFYGIRAGVKNLKSYMGRGLNTVSKIISTWAPSSENNTSSYIASVCKSLGVSPDTPLSSDSSTLLALISAIIKHECGINPYSSTLIKQAIEAA
jgi:hypothetical protein